MIDLYTRKLRRKLPDCSVERVDVPFLDRIVMYEHAHRVIHGGFVSTRLAMMNGSTVHIMQVGTDHYHAMHVQFPYLWSLATDDNRCLTYDQMITISNQVAVSCM